MDRIYLMIIMFGILLFLVSTEPLSAQRKVVRGKELTGVFRHEYDGKFKGSFNEIKILALGANKVKVSFNLVYPYFYPNRPQTKENLTVNRGEADGEAKLNGDTAIYSNAEYGETCEITIKFVKPGQIKVTQIQDGAGCGFGAHVSAQGIYMKISRAKPNI